MLNTIKLVTTFCVAMATIKLATHASNTQAAIIATAVTISLATKYYLYKYH